MERRAEPRETRLHNCGLREGTEGDGIDRLQNTIHRSLILILGGGLAGRRVCLLKLTRPSVIILLHQKGPGPALSRERPRSLTSPSPAEAPSPRAGLARSPTLALLPRLSRATLAGTRRPGKQGASSSNAGAPLHLKGARSGGSRPPSGPGLCPHGVLSRPVPNPSPVRAPVLGTAPIP